MPVRPCRLENEIACFAGIVEEDENMKCFTERAVLMGVTALILSCVANHAGQTASVPAGDTAAAPGTNRCPLVSENGATAGDLSGPQPAREAPASNNVAFVDNTASAGLPAHRKPALNYLALRSRAFPGPVRLLSLDPPATPSKSSADANGEMIFRMIGPGISTAPEFDDQPRPIEGMSTRAWTTIAGWHPGESAFPNGRYPGAHSNLISLAF
jgi:hypothetical protein